MHMSLYLKIVHMSLYLERVHELLYYGCVLRQISNYPFQPFLDAEKLRIKCINQIFAV